MKRTLAMIVLLGVAGVAAAQESEETKPAPDYSKPTVIRILANSEDPPQQDPPIKFTFGGVSFRALGTRWKIGYLPIMAPFQGSFNSGRGFGADLPNPFILTNTQVPHTARSWRTRRALSGELKRIERTERRKEKIDAEVRVNP